jgi:alkyl hydroperoxide reductase subunit AhpC
MIELGQLEKRHDDFASRNTRVLVVSMEPQKTAQLTQADFPHLLVLADAGRGISQALELIHAHAAPDKSDVDTPATIITDRGGTVRWFYRTKVVIARLSPDEVLSAIDSSIPKPR